MSFNRPEPKSFREEPINRLRSTRQLLQSANTGVNFGSTPSSSARPLPWRRIYDPTNFCSAVTATLFGRQRDEQRVFEAGLKDATMYSTLDGAKKCAKQLKRILEASALIYPLSRCQAAVAMAGGYQDWHDLNARIGQRPRPDLPYDYWGNLINALPQPCHFSVTSFLSAGRDATQTPSDLWARDILPYVVSLEIVLRTNALPLRPGSGLGQRLRLAIVSGMLLNVEGQLSFSPKLDPQRLQLLFEDHPASILPDIARNPQFNEAINALATANILKVEKGTTTIKPPESPELHAEVLSRASQWQRDQKPTIQYTTIDENLATVIAHQEGIEWRDAGPKTPYDKLQYRGVSLQSRYSVAHEFMMMKAVIDAMPDDVRLRIESLWCDSKACAVYSVTVVLGMHRRWLGEDIRDSFRAATSGFNGVCVYHGKDEQFFDPEWPNDEKLMEALT